MVHREDPPTALTRSLLQEQVPRSPLPGHEWIETGRQLVAPDDAARAIQLGHGPAIIIDDDQVAVPDGRAAAEGRHAPKAETGPGRCPHTSGSVRSTSS